ncbi:MAG TPA: GGDEF domain-containing protein [Burkholderiales bacterium]|nr:GGDEF domain-containing protein [Burkholderiales bacterium]
MVEIDAELERADRARQAQDRAQSQRLRWIGAIALSYAVDTLFLALYAGAGTVSLQVALAYGGAGFAFCLAYALLVAPGWNLNWRDPSMMTPSVLWGVLAQLLVVAMAPQITFPYLVNLFTVFAFGMLWLKLRQAAAVWTLAMAGTGAVLYLGQGRLGVAAANTFELTLSWLFLSVILSRSLLLSIYANGLRRRLSENRRELAAALGQIQELVHYDELTKAFNRRSLVARLGEELSRSQRTRVPFCVAMLDLDNFKNVNDSYGHATGDAVLRDFAALAQATMRKTDVFGRYGGEEFMMILTASGRAGADGAVERARAAAAGHAWGMVAPGLKLTISAGLAEYRQGESVEQLINRADGALYDAKRAGRNRVEVAD